MYQPQQYAKAITAAATAGGGALIAALPGGLTVGEVVGVVVITIVAGAATFMVPNKPATLETRPVDEDPHLI